MSAQPTVGVARVIAEMVKGKNEMDTDLGKVVAGALAKNYGVTPDDVAILRLTANGKQLDFIVPEMLGKVGSVPMTSTRALVVRTLREKRPECINNFSASEHHTVFEGVRLVRGQSSDPIQKIISAPILAEGKPAGVIQVCRKGKTPAAAGADFSPKDVSDLSQVATALSSCIRPS